MLEYKTIPYEDKGKYQVLSKGSKEGEFAIICEDSDQAHKLYLSLLLETTPTPIQASEMYFYVKEVNSIKYYLPKDILFPEDEASDIDSCCQSGCKGCPHFKGF